jgi:N utilization substance protein B
MKGGVRSRGRAYALQVLYALDLNALEPAALAANQAAAAGEAEVIWRSFELDLAPESVAFARDLVDAAQRRMLDLDETIVAASRNWRLERMSRVDRNILRLATLELKSSPEVPVKVVINEAVELAKRFGAAESPAFVNGILDRIAQQERGSP